MDFTGTVVQPERANKLTISNLKTFKVDLNRSLELSKLIPAGKIKIAESGIDNAETIICFKDAGYKGFLIGETFMKQTDPGDAFKEFVKQIK